MSIETEILYPPELEEVNGLLDAVEEEIQEIIEVEELQSVQDVVYVISNNCLNCNLRKYRLGRKVYCSVDECLRSERIFCTRWIETTNNRILSHQKKLLPIDQNL